MRFTRLMSDGIGLGHLRHAVAKAHDPSPGRADERLRHPEHLASVVGVELDRDVPAKLDMLALIVAHRDVGRLVEQDVRRLQHRIIVEADAGAVSSSCLTFP
jgi:hypothetical protein